MFSRCLSLLPAHLFSSLLLLCSSPLASLPEALGAAAALHSTTTTSEKAMYDFRATASMMSYAEIDKLCSASHTDKQQSLREH